MWVCVAPEDTREILVLFFYEQYCVKMTVQKEPDIIEQIQKDTARTSVSERERKIQREIKRK